MACAGGINIIQNRECILCNYVAGLAPAFYHLLHLLRWVNLASCATIKLFTNDLDVSGAATLINHQFYFVSRSLQLPMLLGCESEAHLHWGNRGLI